MRVDLTVRSGQREHDLSIVTPGPLPWADIVAEVARVSTGDPAAGWWSGAQYLPPATPLGAPALRHGAVLHAGRPASGWARPGVLTLHQVGGPDSGRVVALERGSLQVGRGGDCDVVVCDLDVSRRHARIDVSSTAIRLVDLDSTNGTYVDDTLVGPGGTKLHSGNRISIGDSTFQVVGPVETPAAATFAPDGTVRLVRSPRLVPPAAQSEIVMPVAAATTRPRGVQWVAALLPAVAGGGFAWAMDAPQFLLFALLSPLMMLSSSLGDRLHWRRSRRRAAADYAQRRAAAEQDVESGLRAETQARRLAAPDPAAVLRTCALPGSRLWERRSADPDFLQLRVGTSDVASALMTRTGSALAPAGVVRAVPVGLDLRAGPVGIAGPADIVSGVAGWLLCQLAALHSPVDVSVTFVLTPQVSHRWHWARWLPHVAGHAAVCASEWPTTIARLVSIAEQRRSVRAHAPGGWGGAWHVLVIDSAQDLAEVPGLPGLLDGGAAVGITALCVSEDDTGLPAACRSVVRVSGETGTRAEVRRENGAVLDSVVLDDVSADWADAVARSLAPAVDASGSGLGTLPDSCRLLDLVGLDECGPEDEIRVAQRWTESGGSASTPLGTGPDGPLHLDLVGDGPHALVAGTTGSGKSELLQTMVAGLATRHPPDLLTFLLIDYKGGAAFAECAGLPHAVGVVTDLDSHLTERALRSLNSELRRRERLLAGVGSVDLASYRAVAGVAPLARLVIVVDEFATLAEELPEFVRGLIGVAQRGRSLGVHLVLATQRPGGAVSAEIRANTTARISLRVTDPNESSDVIDAPDASFIERSRPGRAYLRTGSSLVCFQTAQASGRPDHESPTAVLPLAPWRRPASAMIDESTPTDLARVVAVVNGAAQRSGRAVGRAPWVAPLPERVGNESLPAAAVQSLVPYALVDLPDEQRRDTLRIDLAAGSSVLAVGAARSGRTGLLTSIALACASVRTPDELHVYVIDARSDLAAVLGALPHCATVVGPDDVTIAPTLLRRLERALARSSDARGPREHRQAPPASLLLLDNWETLCATLPDNDAIESADALAALQRLGAAGRLTIVVSGDRTALAPRFAAGFDEKLLLRLRDRNDYWMAGIAPRDAPTSMPPGRALRAADGAGVQIAFVGDEPGVAAARRTVSRLSTRHASCARDLADTELPTGEPRTGEVPTDQLPTDELRPDVGLDTGLPVRLRPLPRRVALDRLPRLADCITLGIGGDAAHAVVVDLFAGCGRLLVAGPPRSGRSSVLRSVLVQSVHAGIRVVVGATARSPLRTLAEQLGACVIDPASPAAELRRDPARRTMLIVDDCEMYLDEPIADTLTAWVRDADPTLAAVVAGRTEDLATSYRGLGAQVRRTNCGLLLRPGPVDGELLGVRLPRRPSSGPPGRGVLVGDPSWGALFAAGEPVSIQVALP